MPGSGSLWTMVHDAAAAAPAAPALHHAGAAYSFGELVETANRSSRELADHGVAGGPVAVVAAKSPESVAALLALSNLGSPAFIAAENTPTEQLGRLSRSAACTHIVRVSSTGALEVTQLPRPTSPATSAAVILTTSGSTGLPKLVPLPDTAIANFINWARTTLDLGSDTVALSYAPLNFDLSLLDVWAVLCSGGCSVLVSSTEAADPGALAQILTSTKPDLVQAVPLLLRLLSGSTGLSVDSVTRLILTGEPFPTHLWTSATSIFPAATVLNVYGATETNDSFLHEVLREDVAQGRVPIGRPLRGVEALLVDGDSEVTGPGVGELVVSTPFQSPGYLDHVGPDDAFHVRPGRAGVFYRTGDIAQRDEAGTFHLVGRASNVVKVRGVRTNLNQVEAALNAHNDVVEAVVVPLQDPADGENVLHAAIEYVRETRPDTLGLRQHCRSRLALASVPTRYHQFSTLPRTSSGKVDRSAISAHIRHQEKT